MARKSRKSGTITIPKKKYHAGGYVRLSVEKESDSVENQIDVISSFLNTNSEINLKKYYVDRNLSGTNREREEFLRLLSDVRSGEINCVIVKDLSRFARDYIEAGDLLENIFPILGVRFISIVDGYDSETDEGKEFYSLKFKNIINQAYARGISKNVKKAYDIRKETNIFFGNPPYGYCRAKDGSLIIDKSVADVVKDIYNQFLNGCSMFQIAKGLNKRKMLTPGQYFYKDKKELDSIQIWTTKTIKRILTNKTYAGYIIRNKTSTNLRNQVRNSEEIWEEYANTHEPIIDLQKFDMVQKDIHKRYGKFKKKHNRYSPNPFTGVLYCAVCKKALNYSCVTTRDNKKQYRYYCKTHYSSAGNYCKPNLISRDKLEQTVKNVINMKIKLLADMQQLVEQNKVVVIKEIENTISKKENELNRVSNILDELYEDLVEEKFDSDIFIKLKENYYNEKKSIEEELILLNKDKQKFIHMFQTDKWLYQYLHEGQIQKLDAGVISLFIRKIYIEDRCIEIKFAFQDSLDSLIDCFAERGTV